MNLESVLSGGFKRRRVSFSLDWPEANFIQSVAMSIHQDDDIISPLNYDIHNIFWGEANKFLLNQFILK